MLVVILYRHRLYKKYIYITNLIFKQKFINRDFKNSIIKDMWSIINTENISTKIVLDLFDGVETDLKEKIEINKKKDLLIEESKARIQVTGDWMKPLVQAEAKWRYNLYKSFLSFVGNDLGVAVLSCSWMDGN